MFFANCGYACPVLVNDMQRLRTSLPAEVRAKARFVLVSFDTARDTPEALHAFFLDPTHVRPLFPETLTILLESLHFVALKTHFLNPQPRQTEDSERRPQDFADYLLVAIKDGDLEPKTSNDKQPGRLGQPHKPAPTAPPSA